MQPSTATISAKRSAFLAFAAADKKVAHEISEELGKRGIQVTWLDNTLTPGERWLGGIERIIKSTDLFLVLLSRAARSSMWMLSDMAMAVSSSMSRPLRIVPVLLDHNVDIPPLLTGYQGIRYFDKVHLQEQLDKLAEAVTSHDPPRFDYFQYAAEARSIEASRMQMESELLQHPQRRSSRVLIVFAAVALAASVSGAILMRDRMPDKSDFPLHLVLVYVMAGFNAFVLGELVFVQLLKRRSNKTLHED